MTRQEAKKHIKDFCIHANDCHYGCDTCPRFIELMNCETLYPEDEEDEQE